MKRADVPVGVNLYRGVPVKLLREPRGVEAISEAQVNGRTERIRAMIADKCIGTLIDQGEGREPVCPVDTDSNSMQRRLGQWY